MIWVAKVPRLSQAKNQWSPPASLDLRFGPANQPLPHRASPHKTPPLQNGFTASNFMAQFGKNMQKNWAFGNAPPFHNQSSQITPHYKATNPRPQSLKPPPSKPFIGFGPTKGPRVSSKSDFGIKHPQIQEPPEFSAFTVKATLPFISGNLGK